MAKHWTVISYSDADEWDDESDHYDSKTNATEYARKLAAASAKGKFTVVQHDTVGTYARSPSVITLD